LHDDHVAERSAVRVAVVGCGRILPRYFPHVLFWPDLIVDSWTDLNDERARAAASMYGAGKARSLTEVLGDPGIDIVFNLTPAVIHSDISEAALRAGKSVYTEAPLAMDLQVASKLIDLAAAQGARIGAGPDVVLAFPGSLVEAGIDHLAVLAVLLGRIVGVAAMSRDFFSRMLPIIPVHSANTHFAASIGFEADVLATPSVGFGLGASRSSNVEIHGTEGALLLPPPREFCGDIQIWRKGAETPAVESVGEDGRHRGWNRPGVGLADFADALRTGRPHQATAELAWHVLEVMTRIDESGTGGMSRDIRSAPAPAASI
jgi:predicted dehydrogenase